MSTYYNWYYRHFRVPQLLQFPSEVEVLIPFFTFFSFHSVVSRDSKVHNSASSLFFLFFFFFFFFFFHYYKIWQSDRDFVYLEILNFVRLIFQDRFWVVHIPFVRMVKLQLLAQFPVDPLAHTVVLSLIFSLC